MFEFPLFLNYRAEPPNPVSYNLGTEDYDPYYEKVVLKLPLTNNSLKDESIAPKTITNYNTVSSSSYKKVGNASRYFSGASNNYISCGDLPEWDFSGEDFTVEFWFYTSVLPTVVDWFHLIGNGDSTTGGWRILIHKTGYINFNPYTSTGNQNYGTYDSSIKAGSWTHYAASKRGANLFLFLNGKLNRKWNFSGSLVNSSLPLRLGSTDGSNWNLPGYMNDIRITKGVARYTKSFELLNTITSKVKSPVPIVDPSFGLGINNKYQGALYLNNNVVKGGGAFEYPGERSLSSSIKPLKINPSKLTSKKALLYLRGIAGLPNMAEYTYYNNNKKLLPVKGIQSVPSGWSITAKDGFYLGGVTQAQNMTLNLPTYNNATNPWTLICRIKPTLSESVSTALSCTGLGGGTAAPYEMFLTASHQGSNRGAGLTLGTNQAHIVLHGDATYTPVVKISGLSINSWCWVVMRAASDGSLYLWIYNNLGQILGFSSATCTANVISPLYIGSNYIHGQGYISNIMIFDNGSFGIGYNLFKTVFNPMEIFEPQ
jgi:hypothetical protein